MKKMIVLITIFGFFCSMVGCSKTENDKLLVYSFSGENEYISISNGVIVLDDSKQILSGGDLVVKGNELTNISDYTTTFYLENKENSLLSNSVTGTIDGSTIPPIDLGTISGVMIKETDIDKLENNLWFELKTIDLNGKEKNYQLQLELTDITEIENN